MQTTLWQLGVYMAMIGLGGGLMFKGLKGDGGDDSKPTLDHQDQMTLMCFKNLLSCEQRLIA